MVLERSGIIEIVGNPGFVATVLWVLVALFLLSTLLHALSRSSGERRIMAPLFFVLTVLCLLVALGPGMDY